MGGALPHPVMPKDTSPLVPWNLPFFLPSVFLASADFPQGSLLRGDKSRSSLGGLGWVVDLSPRAHVGGVSQGQLHPLSRTFPGLGACRELSHVNASVCLCHPLP